MEKIIALSSRFNTWLLAASGLMLLTAAVHYFAGGEEIYVPLRASQLDPVVITVLSVVWHVVTVLLILFFAGLLWLAKNYNPALACFIAASHASFVILFLGYGFADLGTVAPVPQWTVFALVLILMVIGHRRRQ